MIERSQEKERKRERGWQRASSSLFFSPSLFCLLLGQRKKEMKNLCSPSQEKMNAFSLFFCPFVLCSSTPSFCFSLARANLHLCFFSETMAVHQPDLVMCRKQPGIGECERRLEKEETLTSVIHSVTAALFFFFSSTSSHEKKTPSLSL